MKKKMLKSSVNLGVLMALAVMGNAMAADPYGVYANTDSGTKNLNSDTDKTYESSKYGISAAGKKDNEVWAKVTAPNITFKVINDEKKQTINGAYAQNFGGISLGDENTQAVNIFVTNNAAKDSSTKGNGIQSVSNSVNFQKIDNKGANEIPFSR